MEDMKSLHPFADKKLKYIDVVFENCEVYSIPAEGIYKLSLGDITHSLDVHVNGLSKYTKPGELYTSSYTDFVWLALNKKGMETHSDWEGMFQDNDCPLFAERVEGNDITHLDLIFEDNTNLYVGVPWEDGSSEWVNGLQKNDIRNDILFIHIAEKQEISDEELKEINDGQEQWHQFDLEDEEEKSIQLKFNDKFDDIIEDEEELNFDVPNYVEAALEKIDAELDRVMWNIHQQEYESPFSNSGNEYKDDIFEVEAYDWDEDSQQEYNFKWRDYKIRWYKYCGRGMEANRYISPQECAEMLDECLADISGLDIDEDDLFGEMPTAGTINSSCIQCGQPAVTILESGVGACKECLDKLGKEQNKIREEIENSLFEFGFDNYEDVCNIVETFEDIIKFIQNNSSVSNIEALLNCLNASKTVMQLQNHLLSKEKEEEILKKFEEFKKDIDK